MLARQFAESSEHSRRALVIARDSGDLTAMAMHYAHGIKLALVRGDAACLPEGFREALAGAPSMPLVDVERANVLALTGSLRESRSMYDRLCGLLPIPTEHPAWAAVLIQMVELIQRFGDAATAEIAYRQLLPFGLTRARWAAPPSFSSARSAVASASWPRSSVIRRRPWSCCARPCRATGRLAPGRTPP